MYASILIKKINSKFKVSDHIRISKYKNIFTNKYTRNWSEESAAWTQSAGIWDIKSNKEK